MVFIHKHPVLAATLAVCATATLLILGDGMTPVWPLMWIAFIPVLILVAESNSWRVAACAAFLSMLLGSLSFLYDIHFVLGAPVSAWLFPLSIASLLFTMGVILFRALLHRGALLSATVSLPAFWTVIEYLASFAPANGTAGSLAYTQEPFLPILQVASLTGPWGITFLLLLFPTAVAACLYGRSRKPKEAAIVAVAAFTVISGFCLFGLKRLATPAPQQTIKVGLLVTDRVLFAEQPAEMQDLVQGYAVHAERLAREGAKIIVMPEKIGLMDFQNIAAVDAVLQAVADRTGAKLVLGVRHSRAGGSFNEARIYTPARPISTYEKQHMLPQFESNLTPGASLTFLSGSPAPVGVAICKDMDFIRPALDYGRSGVELLLDPAWDFNADRTWHGHIAIMRGVEGGYAIAHAAKGGFLTVTDDRGRILGQIRSDSAEFASLLVDVPLRHDHTLFDNYGTWFPRAAGLLLLGTLMQLMFLPRRNPNVGSMDN
jgi:apolipoprotein N-acyltransferase